MSPTAEELQEAWGGEPLPPLLAQLAAFAESTGGFVVCDFELSPRAQRQVPDALGLPLAVAAGFRMFGRDGMHSLYGLWLVDGASPEAAPVVYVSGEGVGTGVVAGSLERFCVLLAAGKEAVGWVEQWSPGECADVEAYRAWLRDEAGLEPPADPLALVEEGRAAWPSFDAWLEAARE